MFPSSASYVCPPSPCAGPIVSGHGAGHYVGGHGAGHCLGGHGVGPYLSGPSYVSSGGYVSNPHPVYVPGPAPSHHDCSVPPVYLPPPKFPSLPTIHAPNPLTIPLQVPSVIPVGKVCVCKAIQIQPSVVPVAKPVSFF